MKKILVAAAGGVAMAAGTIAYLRNRKSKTANDGHEHARGAKKSKHMTQVFSKAKGLAC